MTSSAYCKFSNWLRKSCNATLYINEPKKYINLATSAIQHVINWASEASPTLGCSIEISRDIYVLVGRYICRVPKCLGGITWPKHAHAQGQFWAVKTVP